MKQVHILHHVRDNAGEDDIKMIGAYASAEAAELALSRARKRPGFRDHPDGFSIDVYELDRDYWEDGFVVVPVQKRKKPAPARKQAA